MKFFKFFVMAFVVLVVVSCSKGGFDKAKYADVIEHIEGFSVTSEDYPQIIAMHDDILSYFEGKYTKEQLKEVGQKVMHEDEVLGAEDYEIFKLLNKCSNNVYGVDLGAEQAKWDATAKRRSDLGM